MEPTPEPRVLRAKEARAASAAIRRLVKRRAVRSEWLTCVADELATVSDPMTFTVGGTVEGE